MHMNIEDEYYFFIQKALTNVDDYKQYFFHMKENILFSIVINNKKIRASFRNNYVKEKDVDLRIHRLINSMPTNEIIEIPKLTFHEKKLFIANFINQSDVIVKEILNKELIEFNEQTDFLNIFIKELQKHDKKLAYDFHLQMGQFFKTKELEKLGPIGISNKSLLLW